VDTRITLPALVANNSRAFTVVGGTCGVPADAFAVSGVVVAVDPTDTGNLKIFALGESAPEASAINFNAGQTRSNNGVFKLGTGGQIVTLPAMGAGQTTHFVLDVTGYFR
jgi:hypothetical protein